MRNYKRQGKSAAQKMALAANRAKSLVKKSSQSLDVPVTRANVLQVLYATQKELCSVNKELGDTKTNLKSVQKLLDITKELKTTAIEQRAAAIEEKTAAIEQKAAAIEQKTAAIEKKAAAIEDMKASQDKAKQYYQMFRIQQQKVKRYTVSQDKLKGQIRLLESVVLPESEKDAKIAHDLLTSAENENSILSEQIAKLSDQLEKHKQDVSNTQVKHQEAERKIKALKAKCNRAENAQEKAVACAKIKIIKEKSNFSLLQKGIYTNEARALARSLLNAGCSQAYVGEVIQMVCQAAGVTVPKAMSARTVKRIALEGGIAAEIQIGFEIAQTEGMTVSMDGTTHKNINYESRHLNLRVPIYDSEEEEEELYKHHSRLLGVHSAFDHKSESQVAGLMTILTRLAERFSQSPLAMRGKASVRVEDILRKMKGMNSDHAEDQKKAFELLRGLKLDMAYETLGAEILLEMELDDLNKTLDDERNEMIHDIGGLEKWHALSPDERKEHCGEMFKKLAIDLGKEKYLTIGTEDQHELDLFIWVGCGMHKCSNGGKRGDIAMTEWWSQNNVEGPIDLPNRDNAPVLAGILPGAEPTDAEKRAAHVTARGGSKCTAISGAVIKDKDTKKGAQDVYRHFMETVYGINMSFPDTSNNCYGSHGEAAAVLITYLNEHVKFLEFLRDKKEKQRFTHMEKNLYLALQDEPTQTELCVLALYAQAITHPYSRQIRGSSTEDINMLDMGPLHDKVKEHHMKVIENPKILLGENSSYDEGAMDGQLWHWPKAVEEIKKKSVDLPYLEPLLVTFFEAALVTWERFTSEFESGGVIDLATAQDKELAWMPPTNDVNEGALGSFRVFIRRKPSASIHLYNALKMLAHNDTEAFMRKHFTEEDHVYLRKEARILDSFGIEKKRRRELAEAQIKRVEEKHEKKRKAAEKKQARETALAQLDLVTDLEVARKLNVAQLNDQLELYRGILGKENVPLKKDLKLKAEKLEALLDVIRELQHGCETSEESEGEEISE